MNLSTRQSENIARQEATQIALQQERKKFLQLNQKVLEKKFDFLQNKQLIQQSGQQKVRFTSNGRNSQHKDGRSYSLYERNQHDFLYGRQQTNIKETNQLDQNKKISNFQQGQHDKTNYTQSYTLNMLNQAQIQNQNNGTVLTQRQKTIQYELMKNQKEFNQLEENGHYQTSFQPETPRDRDQDKSLNSERFFETTNLHIKKDNSKKTSDSENQNSFFKSNRNIDPSILIRKDCSIKNFDNEQFKELASSEQNSSTYRGSQSNISQKKKQESVVYAKKQQELPNINKFEFLQRKNNDGLYEESDNRQIMDKSVNYNQKLRSFSQTVDFPRLDRVQNEKKLTTAGSPKKRNKNEFRQKQ
ncbi:hypothetical protein PPERSA_01197 [Pseudocohnilembus persalinus]|uniref:Uncharacterized protein n=1 Tax=Pseudocohnilembus persalinus TaxID=266149 RepID=A0A0V0R1B4_PSEPJ|nr:hypothetical protein PPERSA_01197 [Pseudocohnilembus persalinus]|eukprot:KRX08267.1 hypothetical protein PPERSA_01197 [Pseudocohnilembus persalinus]